MVTAEAKAEVLGTSTLPIVIVSSFPDENIILSFWLNTKSIDNLLTIFWGLVSEFLLYVVVTYNTLFSLGLIISFLFIPLISKVIAGLLLSFCFISFKETSILPLFSIVIAYVIESPGAFKFVLKFALRPSKDGFSLSDAVPMTFLVVIFVITTLNTSFVMSKALILYAYSLYRIIEVSDFYLPENKFKND